MFGSNVVLEVSGGSELYFPGTTDHGLYLYGKDVRFVLDDSTARMSRLAWGRKSFAGDQHLDIRGSSRLTVSNWARTESQTEDPMASDVRFSFNVPLDYWKAGESAAVYAKFVNTAVDKPFAYRASEPAGKVVFSVDAKSPLVNTGRTRVVQLLEWRAGIDEKSVRLEDGRLDNGTRYARVFYTYGWPSEKDEPEFAGDVPTGVAAEIRGIGGTFLIFR